MAAGGLEYSKMIIRPAKSLRGEIVLPGDKSISHRAAILSAVADGETRIENYATSADCSSTLECLSRLGVGIERDGNTVVVRGVGRTGLKPAADPLDCGNSGTTMRLLAGVLSGQRFDTVLTGDDSLRRRPMRRIIEPMTAMGAAIESDNGCAPLTIHGRNPLDAIEYELPVASAQIKSCVLLAGLNADGETSVLERVPTRDHTERMLRAFGAAPKETSEPVKPGSGRRLTVNGPCDLRSPGNFVIPADISAAAFFIVAAGCLHDSRLRMPGVGVNPTRSGILEIARLLGVHVSTTDEHDINGEPVATISARGPLREQSRNDIRGDLVANVIDELPILAVLGTQLELGLEVRDAAELRVKETDRISAVVENLRRMGAKVEEFDDGFRIERSRLTGARVDSFGDHRIAMAFAVAGILAWEGETEIDNAGCAAVSFPNFFDVLESVVIYE